MDQDQWDLMTLMQYKDLSMHADRLINLLDFLLLTDAN